MRVAHEPGFYVISIGGALYPAYDNGSLSWNRKLPKGYLYSVPESEGIHWVPTAVARAMSNSCQGIALTDKEVEVCNRNPRASEVMFALLAQKESNYE